MISTVSVWKNFIHPLNFVALPILFIISIFCANNIGQYFIILITACCNLLLIVKLVRYRLIIVFILCLLPVLLAIFLSSYIFTVGNSLIKVNMATLLTIRYFSLALISFSYSIHTPFPLVFNYLMQRKILPIKIGYAILAAFNSFHFLAGEFGRIQTAYKMRYGKSCYSPIIFIVLLTAAARYAHNLSISIYSRNINKHKTFVFKAIELGYINYILWIIDLLLVLYILV